MITKKTVVKIRPELHKKLKLFCVEHDIKIEDVVQQAITIFLAQ